MKTRLFKDITTNNLFTLAEIKSEYETAINAEIPIDDDAMLSIIYENLTCTGGNIEIINDDILTWCNEYADFVEAERVMTQEEIDCSIRDIYYAIENNDSDLIESTKDNLYEGDKLLKQLERLIKEV